MESNNSQFVFWQQAPEGGDIRAGLTLIDSICGVSELGRALSPPSGGSREYNRANEDSMVRDRTDLGLTPPGYVLAPPFGGSSSPDRPEVHPARLCIVAPVPRLSSPRAETHTETDVIDSNRQP